MIPQQVIARKRDGRELGADELAGFLQGYVEGAVGDEQMAAFLMAVHFNGMERGELAVLVDAMLHSGTVLAREGDRPRVGKHSTGGVGDKTSLVAVPLAAEMGLAVPKMSGRGLGHTGGTLDKLEAVPGLCVELELEAFARVVRRERCAVIGQSAEIAPLDRRLYALRDLTATVPSLPLITSSIMSKKLAEGLDGLVLDVKVGRGAFLPELADARRLARAMVQVGADRGLAVTAVLTAMDRPLGRAVGNGLEVVEALACLSGDGPDDLATLGVELAAEMAVAGGAADRLEEARARAAEVLAGGSALERFARMARAQGGRVEADRPGFGIPAAPRRAVVRAGTGGVVAAIDPLALGYGVIALGGGRTRKGQTIDPRVGFVLGVGLGEVVSRGDPLGVVHAASRDGTRAGTEALRRAIKVDGGGNGAEAALPLIIEKVRGGPAARAGVAPAVRRIRRTRPPRAPRAGSAGPARRDEVRAAVTWRRRAPGVEACCPLGPVPSYCTW